MNELFYQEGLEFDIAMLEASAFAEASINMNQIRNMETPPLMVI